MVRKYLAEQPEQLNSPAELMVLGNRSLEMVFHFGLHVVHSSVQDASLNEELQTLGIEVAHCKAVISVTRSPRHCATTTIVRNGSGRSTRTASKESLVRIIGRLRRVVESLARTISIELRRSLNSSRAGSALEDDVHHDSDTQSDNHRV